MRRWEHAGDGAGKFWEAGAEGASVTVRFGRTGTVGQTRVKEFDTPGQAEAYLVKAVGEKERKGYVATGGATAAAPAPAVSASASAVSTASTASAPAPAVPVPVRAAAARVPLEQVSEAPAARPDESAFVLPEAWKRNLRPRRGGTPVPVAGPDAGAPARLAAWRSRFAAEVDRPLDAPRSDADLVSAARAHDAGSPDPVGAAVLAALLPPEAERDAVVDAWTLAHGLPFAAVAAVELVECRRVWARHGHRSEVVGIDRAVETHRNWEGGASLTALDRVRDLLAVTDDATYAAAVAALARHRTTPRRRVAVSYLVPTEHAWTDECLARAETREHLQNEVRTLLVRSVTAGQTAAYGGRADLGWRGWTPAVIATVADGAGTAMAPFLIAETDRPYLGTDDLKVLAAALAELPSDEAFQALLDRAGDKHVRVELAAAARRFPVRALRLLALAARADTAEAPLVRRMLAGHVAAHRALALAVLPELPAEAAEIVEPLTRAQDTADDAAPADLPALLTAPPWTVRRAAVTPRIVTGPVAPSGTRVVWREGERRAWATAESWVTGWQPYEPLDTLVDKLLDGSLHGWHTVGVLVNGPADRVRPFLADWDGADHCYDGAEVFKPLVAAHEAAALPPVLRMAAHHPAAMAEVLLPYLDVRVARLMANWLLRLKTAGRTARTWLLRHGTDAARLLVPDAVGAAGPERTAAEGALRALVAAQGPDGVRAAAAEYGEEAALAAGELLATDPLVSALPARMPQAPAWCEPRVLPRIRLRTGATLPVTAVAHLLTMLAVSKPGAPYPGLAEVRELCTPESLAGFAWGLFEEWRVVGMPPKEAWTLHALGWFGDDDTVRALTPVIRAWPGEGAHQRAVEGLDVLAAIGTDTALLHLHGISQRVRFKALRQRAQEKIAEVAEGLGLTGEQLADRLVPDLGLDADGSTVIDYGTRLFTVGFDEGLGPYVLDAEGRRLKDLPKPGARDETELATAERKRYLALKKEVRALAADQVRRLEAAMVDGRSWTGAEFRRLFVEHPLVRHLARRLVWSAERDGTATAFRISGDRACVDVRGGLVAVADDATVTLPHPLRFPGRIDAWSEVLADHGIPQPFPQLGRRIHAATEEEAAGARLTRFEGVTVPIGRLLGLQKRGWERGVPQDAGVERWFHRRLAPERHLVVQLEPGIAVGMPDEAPEQTLDTVWLDAHPGDHWPSRTYPLRFADLDPVTVSELLADLTELTSRS
ncbi:WGR and DUF4132 domain-containing protein [Streptomyces sp. NPDC088090]|uniref:WGR and DUF4132 domain-containing protein n=1 Tax=Streptomyces sp. NPDC088090 TaxID=3365822 RepID=UPI00384D8350